MKHIYLGLALLTAGCITETGGEDPMDEAAESREEAISDGDFTLKAVHSSKCVDVAGASTQNGASVQQYDCNGSGAQVFSIAAVGDGYYKFINKNAQKGLDVKGVSKAAGAQIQIWSYSGTQNEQFKLESVGNNEYKIRARHSQLLLEVQGNNQNNGALLIQAAASSNANQRFRLDAVPGGGGSGGSTSCKRGVAYGYHSPADMQALKPGVSWWYNWSPAPDTGVSSVYGSLGVEFVPMIWGNNFASHPEQKIPAGTKYLLGFNEPNFYAQANLTAQQAAQLWPQIQSIAAAKGMATVSPAVNYCGGGCNQTDPFVYLKDFFAACQGCKVDYVAAHWYACDKGALTWYLSELKKFGKPIWLTEFACLDAADTSPTVQQNYMKDALSVLENDPAVFRYSWFAGRFDGNTNVNLLGADGKLTPLGQTYVTAPQACKP